MTSFHLIYTNAIFIVLPLPDNTNLRIFREIPFSLPTFVEIGIRFQDFPMGIPPDPL